jgi:hypothetical protein
LALLALVILALLPGLLVVRAPWTAVPALSLAFWALSAWWPPLAAESRGRVLFAALLAGATLALLRLLPKHEVPPPPGVAPTPPPPAPPARRGRPSPPLASGPSLLVLSAALAVAAAGLAWPHAPGSDAAFQTTAARAYLWRDGIPAGLEPLLPLAPFGAHAPALATLSGDVARIGGIDPARALALALAAAAAGALLGLFALLATRRPPWTAAAAALLALGLVPWPEWLRALGPVDATLALAFVLPGAALAAEHRSRASAVAAGFLFAAGALAQPVLALAALAAGALVARRAAPGLVAPRLALVAGTAVLFAWPGLWPLARALSADEARAALSRQGLADVAWLAGGLALVVVAPLAVAPLERRGRRVVWAAALGSAVLFVARVHLWIASGQLPPGDLAALRRAAEGPPLSALCAPEGLRDWVPAIAGRPAGDPGPWIPLVYRDEWEARPRRECAPFAR